MVQVTMYTKTYCPYCVMAKSLLASYGVSPLEINIESDPEARAAMMARTERRTVPQIFIEDLHVGGYDDLSALERVGKLAKLLQKTGDK